MFNPLQQSINQFDPTLAIEDCPTPPAQWYTSPDIYQLEKKSALLDGWQLIARLDQLSKPGDYVDGCFASSPYLVFRDQDMQLRAIYNVCPHHGGWLKPNSEALGELKCTYHGWRFDSSGKLLKAPHAGGSKLLNAQAIALKSLALHIWGELVFVNFSANPEPFEGNSHEETYGSFRWEKLKHVKTVRYSLKCNWKVFVDNYLDGGYHVSVLHPDLAQYLNLNSYRTDIYKHSSVQSCSSINNDSTNRLGLKAFYGWFFPNTMVNRYGNWLDINRVVPTSENSCDVIFEYFYEDDYSKTSLDQDLIDSDRVQNEDILISERVQQSMESGAFDKGFYAPKFERPMHHFHRLLHFSFSKYLNDKTAN